MAKTAAILPSFDDFFDYAEREILSSSNRKPDISPEEMRRPGSDAYLTLAGPAVMADQIARRAEEEFLKLYKDTLSGDALDEWAYDYYRLVRLAAAASMGHPTFYRNSSSYGDYAIPQGAIVSDTAGNEYEVLESGTLSGLTPVNLLGKARSAGALSNAKAGAITTVVTALDDTTVMVTNAHALACFTRASAGAAGTIPAGQVVYDIYGGAYETTRALPFSASQTVGHVPAVLLAGSGYGAPAEADSLTEIANPTDLFDTFTVSNPVATGGAFAGGDDDETDGDFKTRIDRFWEAARRGTAAAIVYGALSTPDVRVRYAQLVEEKNPNDMPGQAVKMVVADANGIGNLALTDAVETQLQDYSCAGIHVFLAGGEIEEVDVSLTLALKTGGNQTREGELAQNAVILYLNSRPPSTGQETPDNDGRVLHSAIVELLREIEYLHVPSGAVTLPAADYTPDWGKSARPGTISITWE